MSEHLGSMGFVEHFAKVWRSPLSRAVSPRHPVVLLYHGVPRGPADFDGAAFEAHVAFLKEHFHLLPPNQLGNSREALAKPGILLTFDDGFRNNAEVVAPVLRKHRVPALFFVSSRHSRPGSYLWFMYLRMLEQHFTGNGFNFAGEFWDMSAARRRTTVQRLRELLCAMKPHPAAMYRAIEQDLPQLEDFADPRILNDRCAGMTGEQVGELGNEPLFELGGHTLDHPYLTRCDSPEALRQFQENKLWLERISGKPCSTVSYPLGDYDANVLTQARRAGFTVGHAVSSLRIGDPGMEVERLGVYGASLELLGLKVVFGLTMRRLGIKLG